MWDAHCFIHQLPSPKIALSDNVVFKVADIAAVCHSRKNEHIIFFLNPPSRTISCLPNSTLSFLSFFPMCHMETMFSRCSLAWKKQNKTGSWVMIYRRRHNCSFLKISTLLVLWTPQDECCVVPLNSRERQLVSPKLGKYGKMCEVPLSVPILFKDEANCCLIWHRTKLGLSNTDLKINQ